MTTYKIVRHYSPKTHIQGLTKSSRTRATGLTLEQAQKHCKDPSTKKEGVYFDGYEKE